MSEAIARRTTRQKKPSRQYWYDEQDYSNIVTSKNHQQKDKNKNNDDTNFIAKLMIKFINSTNNKSRNSGQNHTHGNHNQNNHAHGSTNNHSNGKKQNSKAKNQHGQGVKGSRHNNSETNQQNKNENKGRSGKNSKNNQILSTSLQTDLSYHNALNEHVQKAYPNINSLSSDMLRELSIPTEILNKPTTGKPKSDKKKSKQENKPFKRQSYHVAIAYHIHLKQVKGHKTVQYVDPTFPAKKLREEETKKQQ